MKCLRSKEKKGKFTIKKLKRQVKGITLIALVVTKMMVVDLLQASFGWSLQTTIRCCIQKMWYENNLKVNEKEVYQVAKTII